MCFHCFPSNSWQSIYLLKTELLCNILTSHVLAYAFILSSKKTWPSVIINEALGYTQVPDHRSAYPIIIAAMIPRTCYTE